jgi:hypothetical protein
MCSASEKWSGIDFKGISLLGDAVLSGTSPVLSEADLSAMCGKTAEGLENWLEQFWCEHDIHAVMEGREQIPSQSMLLRRPTGLKKKVLGKVMEHVLWRFFSPSETALREWSPEEIERYCSVSPALVSTPASSKQKTHCVSGRSRV